MFICDRMCNGLDCEFIMKNILETDSIDLNIMEKTTILMGLYLLEKKQTEDIYKVMIDQLIDKISK